MSIAVEDWDDLADARRRRVERGAAPAPETGAAPAVQLEPEAEAPVGIDDLRYDADEEGEDLRVPYWVAGGNVAVFLLAHLTGVVEFLGVSFAASVGLLLASYILREWHRDRAALVCLLGALPLPLTIFSLLS
jgi:hypothetical protein